MKIKAKQRAAVEKILTAVPYRKIIAEKLSCHPNTVSNALKTGRGNTTVINEILKLAVQVAEENKVEEESAEEFMQQLSAA